MSLIIYSLVLIGASWMAMAAVYYIWMRTLGGMNHDAAYDNMSGVFLE